MRALKILALVIAGFVAGGLLGLGAGLAWTELADTSCFEGWCGYMVVLYFVPIGALAGAIAGGVFGARRV